MDRYKILFLTANPGGTDDLNLAQELKMIAERIGNSTNLTIESLFSATPVDLVNTVARIKPDILHISGHGTIGGEIVLNGDDNSPIIVGVEMINEIFNSFDKKQKLVIFNFCNSHMLAREIGKHVDFLIGMSSKIGNEESMVFVTHFYQYLGQGHAISKAFNWAKLILKLKFVEYGDVPQLVVGNPRILEDIDFYNDFKENLQKLKGHELSYLGHNPETLRQNIKDAKNYLINTHRSSIQGSLKYIYSKRTKILLNNLQKNLNQAWPDLEILGEPAPLSMVGYFGAIKSFNKSLNDIFEEIEKKINV